ncbi:MAG TPA: 50S ribosomal protein L11 methyltransferase [Gammaproteobacteria bacterium]
MSDAGWQRLELHLAAGDLPRAEALLRLLGAESVSLLPGAADDIVEPAPGTMPLWPRIRVRALFPPKIDMARAAKILDGELGAGVASCAARVRDEEWADALIQRPVRLKLGARLLLADAAADIDDGERMSVRLHRGFAFGTGDHPTTRLCLEWLDAHLRRDATVIDFGCGSGVLAIAALRLGASRAWGVDIEPQALTASADNALLNGVSDRLWLGAPDALPRLRVEVLIANILAQPLIELASRFAELCAPSASLVLAGVHAHQAADVESAYLDGFLDFRRVERDGWVCLSATRKSRQRAAAAARCTPGRDRMPP